MITHVLENKIALVCGGSKGIGRGVALELSRAGARVTLMSRTEDHLQQAVSEITAETGAAVDYVVGDAATPGEGARLVAWMKERHGGLDILLNNAGGPPMGSFTEHSDEAWDNAYRVSLKSVIEFTRAAAPVMRGRGYGRIINITSLLAKEPGPLMVLSSTFRAGVSAFSKAICTELIKDGITINTVLPSAVWSDRAESLTRQTAEREGISVDEAKARAVKNLPPGRYAEAEELGALVAFLASPTAAYLTGLSLPVDGGLGKSIF
ncbi:MAG: SDR family oxidoreductase [Candidatus Methylacidiphilales bacterium]